MNCPTTRCSTPAAAPRIGRGGAPWGPNPRRVSPSPPSPTTSPPTPGSRPPICGCWRPSSTSPGPTPAAGPAITRSLPGSIATRGPSGGHAPPGGPRLHPSATVLGDPTGRLIHLTCRGPIGNGPGRPRPRARHGHSQCGARGLSAAHAEGDVIVERLRTEELALPERSRPDPAPPPVDLPTPSVAVPLQAKVPAPAPAPPVIDPPQPELSVAASAQSWYLRNPSSTLRSSGFGPRAAYPCAQDVLGLVPSRPAPAPGRPRSL